MAVTNRYKWPKLSEGVPRGVLLKVKVYTCLGRRPIPKCAEISKSTLREVLKVALGPSATEADAHTFASLRSLDPAAPRASICSFASSPLDAALSGAAAAAHG